MFGRNFATSDEEVLFDKALEGILEDRVFTVLKCHVFRNPMNRSEVYPVEISMAAFSLRDGIQDVMSTLICPEPLPTGLGYAVKELNENTGLPRPGVDDERFTKKHREYGNIAADIKRFMQKYAPRRVGKNNIILFAMAGDISDAKDTLKWFFKKCTQAGSDFAHVAQAFTQLEFLDLSRLFYKLSKAANLKNTKYFPPTVQFDMDILAEKQLNKPNQYSFRCEISCAYHSEHGYDKIDMCAKNWILKRIFLILDELVPPLNLEKKAGHSIFSYTGRE